MSDLEAALLRLCHWLERAQIPYMVIGGFAALVWGEPRLTRDLDVTISVRPDLLESTIRAIVEEFSPRVQDLVAFARSTRVAPINIGDVPADLIVAGLPYEEEAIRRAQPIGLAAGTIMVASAEDVILHKIVAGRPRDQEDIDGIFRHRHSQLDYSYLDPRVAELADALADRTMLDRYVQLKTRWGHRD